MDLVHDHRGQSRRHQHRCSAGIAGVWSPRRLTICRAQVPRRHRLALGLHVALLGLLS